MSSTAQRLRLEAVGEQNRGGQRTKRYGIIQEVKLVLKANKESSRVCLTVLPIRMVRSSSCSLSDGLLRLPARSLGLLLHAVHRCEERDKDEKEKQAMGRANDGDD
jgi:hypothetical protein